MKRKPMLEVVLEELDARKGSLPRVAREAGISYRTLQKIAQREIRNPGVQHVQRLFDYFAAQRRRRVA